MQYPEQVILTVHFLVGGFNHLEKYESQWEGLSHIPSGNLTQLWKITIFNGKIHYKWSFSIAMLNYQRVLWKNNV
jgi:hypothetical protein